MAGLATSGPSVWIRGGEKPRLAEPSLLAVLELDCLAGGILVGSSQVRGGLPEVLQGRLGGISDSPAAATPTAGGRATATAATSKAAGLHTSAGDLPGPSHTRPRGPEATPTRGRANPPASHTSRPASLPRELPPGRTRHPPPDRSSFLPAPSRPRARPPLGTDSSSEPSCGSLTAAASSSSSSAPLAWPSPSSSSSSLSSSSSSSSPSGCSRLGRFLGRPLLFALLFALPFAFPSAWPLALGCGFWGGFF